MRTDRGLNLKSKKQFGHSCSDSGHSAEHAKSTPFFLTLWLQDLCSMGETKAGCFYPLDRTFFLPGAVLADPRRGSGRQSPAPSSDAAACVGLGESFHPPSVQTQILMLSKAAGCLFVCVKPVAGNPQA